MKDALCWAVWQDCKFVHDPTYLMKASLKVAKHLFPSFNDEKNKDHAIDWAKQWQFLVLHLVNERRNYVISRLAKLYIDELTAECGKASKKPEEEEDEGEDNDEDGEAKAPDLSNPNQLTIKPDL